MKIIITESQLNDLIEAYIEDPYLIDNDIYDYQPTYDEIKSFNAKDKYPNTEFKGFGNVKKNNVRVPSIDNARTYQKGKKYTGNATLYFLYPDGHKEFISKNKIPIITNMKKNMMKNDPKNKNSYMIIYELQ